MFCHNLLGLVASMGFIHCKHDLMPFIHGREQHSKHTDTNSFTFSPKIPPHDVAEVIKTSSNAQMCPSIRRLSYLTHPDGSDSISTARKFCAAMDYLKVVRLSSSCDDSQWCQRTFDCSLHLRVAPGSFQPSSRANATETMEHTAENTHTDRHPSISHHSLAVSAPHAGYAPWHKDISYTFLPAWV